MRWSAPSAAALSPTLGSCWCLSSWPPPTLLTLLPLYAVDADGYSSDIGYALIELPAVQLAAAMLTAAPAVQNAAVQRSCVVLNPRVVAVSVYQEIGANSFPKKLANPSVPDTFVMAPNESMEVYFATIAKLSGKTEATWPYRQRKRWAASI